MASYVLDAAGIETLTRQLAKLLTQDAGLRALQSRNALRAQYFDQPTGGITGPTVYFITQSQRQAGEEFSFLVVGFDATSGTGRYRIDGPPPTPGIGMPIPSGMNMLTIPGNDNIRNFQMIADAGQTLTFARYLLL